MITDLSVTKSIPRVVSTSTIQENCKPGLFKIIKELKDKYGNKILSIYLYGSFSEGRGNLRTSDLDLFIITKEKLDLLKFEIDISSRYANYFIDVNFLSEKEDIVLKDMYGWLAFLKIFCVCVEGKDISSSLSEYSLTKKLIAGFVEDTDKLAKGYLEFGGLVKKKSLAKLIIRRIYYAELERHLKWTTVLQEQYDIIKELFPKREKDFADLFKQAKGEKNLDRTKLEEIISFTLNLTNKITSLN